MSAEYNPRVLSEAEIFRWSALTTDENEGSDVSLLDARLRECGYQAVECGGEGDCMFRSLGFARFGDPEKCTEIRAAVVDWLRRNWRSNWDDVHPDRDAYLAEMAQQGTWGDQLCLLAFASLYNQSVVVFSSVRSAHEPIAISPLDASTANPPSTVVLAHVAELHYQGVTTADEEVLPAPIQEDGDNPPAPQPDRSTNTRSTPPLSFAFLGRSHEVDSWIAILRTLCELVYQRHSDTFKEKVLQLRGRNRPYFAEDPTVIGRTAGNLRIDDLFYESALSSQRVVTVCRLVVKAFGYQPGDFVPPLASKANEPAGQPGLEHAFGPTDRTYDDAQLAAEIHSWRAACATVSPPPVTVTVDLTAHKNAGHRTLQQLHDWLSDDQRVRSVDLSRTFSRAGELATRALELHRQFGERVRVPDLLGPRSTPDRAAAGTTASVRSQLIKWPSKTAARDQHRASVFHEILSLAVSLDQSAFSGMAKFVLLRRFGNCGGVAQGRLALIEEFLSELRHLHSDASKVIEELKAKPEHEAVKFIEKYVDARRQRIRKEAAEAKEQARLISEIAKDHGASKSGEIDHPMNSAPVPDVDRDVPVEDAESLLPQEDHRVEVVDNVVRSPESAESPANGSDTIRNGSSEHVSEIDDKGDHQKPQREREDSRPETGDEADADHKPEQNDLSEDSDDDPEKDDAIFEESVGSDRSEPDSEDDDDTDPDWDEALCRPPDTTGLGADEEESKATALPTVSVGPLPFEIPDFDSDFFDQKDNHNLIRFLVQSTLDSVWREVFSKQKQVQDLNPADDGYDSARSLAVQRVAQLKSRGVFGSRVADKFQLELDRVHSLRTQFLDRRGAFAHWNDERALSPHISQYIVAARLIKPASGVGNWCGTGAGKTVSAMLAMRAAKAKCVVYVAPANVCNDARGIRCDVQRCEDSKKAPLFRDMALVRVLTLADWEPVALLVEQAQRAGSGSAAEQRPVVLLVAYGKFQQWTDELQEHALNACAAIKPDMIVVDEVQHAKSEGAQQAKNLRLFVARAHVANSACRVLGMSATPIVNKVMDGFRVLGLFAGQESVLELPDTTQGAKKLAGSRYGDRNPNSQALAALLHEEMTTLPSVRWIPQYGTLREELRSVDVTMSQFEQVRAGRSVRGFMAYEEILTRLRLPSIIAAVRESLARREKVVVYSDAIKHDASTGMPVFLELIGSEIRNTVYGGDKQRVGYYTGADAADGRDGLSRDEAKFKFCEFSFGDAQGIDVLCCSSAISTGVDGLQQHARMVVFNVIPWTAALYQQVVGRVYRQGGSKQEVHVVIPQVRIHVDRCQCPSGDAGSSSIRDWLQQHDRSPGDFDVRPWLSQPSGAMPDSSAAPRAVASDSLAAFAPPALEPCMSYCERKWKKVCNKHTWLEAVVDGIVATVKDEALEQEQLLHWALRELFANIADSRNAPPEAEPLRAASLKARRRDLARLNAAWYKMPTADLSQMMRRDRSQWKHYHELCASAHASRNAAERPCVHAVERIRELVAAHAGPRPLAVADFGCGLGYLANELLNKEPGRDRVTVRSFDHQRAELQDWPHCAWLSPDDPGFVTIEEADCSNIPDAILEPRSLDVVVSCNALFGRNHGEAILRSAAQKLRLGGRLLLIEFPNHLGGKYAKLPHLFPSGVLEPLGFKSKPPTFLESPKFGLKAIVYIEAELERGTAFPTASSADGLTSSSATSSRSSPHKRKAEQGANAVVNEAASAVQRSGNEDPASLPASESELKRPRLINAVDSIRARFESAPESERQCYVSLLVSAAAAVHLPHSGQNEAVLFLRDALPVIPDLGAMLVELFAWSLEHKQFGRQLTVSEKKNLSSRLNEMAAQLLDFPPATAP